jgi:hypothetical protein
MEKKHELRAEAKRKARVKLRMSRKPFLDRSSPIKKAFNWSYPVEIQGRFYILIVQYVPM